MTAFQIPASTHIGGVRLRVADLERSLRFYRDLLGLKPIPPDDRAAGAADAASRATADSAAPPATGPEESTAATEHAGRRVALAATGAPPALVTLDERPGARPRPPHTAGLYHFAILVPSRRDLARVFHRLRAAGWALEGASDHAVSEALYLSDPDRNGIEIYADRPRDAWPRHDDEIEMTTLPLDLRDLGAEAAGDPEPAAGLPPGTTIGHIHLHVPDLHEAEAFYHGLLGFDVVTRRYPGALFLSAGGYHHHVAVNTWAGRSVPAPPADAAGLIDYEIVIPDAVARIALGQRLRAAGLGVEGDARARRLLDPSGTGVVLRG